MSRSVWNRLAVGLGECILQPKWCSAWKYFSAEIIGTARNRDVLTRRAIRDCQDYFPDVAKGSAAVTPMTIAYHPPPRCILWCRNHPGGQHGHRKKRTPSWPTKLNSTTSSSRHTRGSSATGANNPYTSLNENMFTLLNPPGNLAIRLPEAEREKFIKKYKTKLFEAYGVVMKEYVAVPDSLLPKTRELAKYLVLSYEYAKTLKPKATTRRIR